LDNKVNIFKCAISDETRQANLYVPSKDFGDTLETSSSLNPNERPRHSEILNVPTISLDEHIKQTGDVKVDIIQLDIENYEHVVLEGASDILSTSRPMLIIEVLKTSHFDRLEAICRRFNYKIIQLLPDEILCHASVVYNPKSKNQIFCPTEKINVIKTIAKSLGLPFKY
jgi:FkbM family methyltransferase